jgi:hypothetical protein
MKIKGYEIPIGFFAVFAISSFVPIIQIMMAYLNGAILWIPEQIFKFPAHKMANGFNLVGIVISTIFYYKTSKIAKRILSAIFVSFFVNCFILFAFEDYFIDTAWYGTQFIISAIAIGLILLIVDEIKLKQTTIN